MAAPPACDIACQKNKRLATLLSTLQEATVNKGTNPEAYEKARMNYYTLKEGQSWLHTEKEKIANNKVTPLLDMYTKQFQTLQNAADKKAAVKQALDDAKAGEVGDEDETRFIHSQIEKEYNKAGVQTRLMELTKSPVEFDTIANLVNKLRLIETDEKLLFISDQIASFIYYEIIDFIINNDINNYTVLEIIICSINIF
jgi:hypothetical protein